MIHSAGSDGAIFLQKQTVLKTRCHGDHIAWKMTIRTDGTPTDDVVLARRCDALNVNSQVVHGASVSTRKKLGVINSQIVESDQSRLIGLYDIGVIVSHIRSNQALDTNLRSAIIFSR